MILLESLLLCAVLVIALTVPSLGTRWLDATERKLRFLANRPTLAVLSVGLSALVLRAALLPILPIPEPIVHDEFGYLLAADTFAHGRLTNPTHPMWVHFETFSIIQKPTYQCFAQPAQGFMLAIGRVLMGHPFWGVWLSVGLMCAALCWMLQGWLPPGWALVGGYLAVLRYGVTTYWANSYWGGAIGVIGGALLVGALPRIKRSPSLPYALLMGLGLAILANSRPYEGLVLSLPVAASLLWWAFQNRGPALLLVLQRVILPLSVVVVAIFLFVGYYCWRVTGNPFQLAYSAERQQYASVPYMLWQPLPPQPVYHSDVVRNFYAHEEVLGYQFFRSLPGALVKLGWTWRFYLGPALTFPLLMMLITLPYGFSWKSVGAEMRFALFAIGITLVAVLLGTFYSPHYLGPAVPLLLFVVLRASRRLREWQWHSKPSGLFLSRAVIGICFMLFGARVVMGAFPSDHFYAPAWFQDGPPSCGRAQVINRLNGLQEKHLVIVRYKADHKLFCEWVYNEANIDASKIVWARELTPAENEQLLNYFKNRRAWLLEADENPPKLSEYPGQSLYPAHAE